MLHGKNIRREFQCFSLGLKNKQYCLFFNNVDEKMRRDKSFILPHLFLIAKKGKGLGD